MSAVPDIDRLVLPRRSLRIAMVTETFPPEVNGVARTMGLLVEALRARGHQIQLVRPRQGEADAGADVPGFREVLRPGFPIPRYTQLRMGLPAGRSLLRTWRCERPDVVHIATEGPLGWSALAAARKLQLPVATDFHTNFQAYSGHYGMGWFARPVAAYLRRFHNRAACTMVPTAELASQLSALGFERLRVVGRGVNADVFDPRRRSDRLRASWGTADADPVVLCVSRFAPEKNFPLVLETFRNMQRAHPAARLVLVGDGPMLGELRREHSGPVIAGMLVNGDLSAHYASADIFLFPSVTETFGNVTLEAMASGLAVVAYDYAAARQYIRHGESGLLAPLGDATAFIREATRLVTDPALVVKLRRSARRAAEQLSWNRVAADFEQVLLDTQDGRV